MTTELENQITDETTGRRFYEWGDEQYWSVTTLIKGGVPAYGLIEWAAKATAEAAVALAETGELVALIEAKGSDAAIRRLRQAKEDAREDSADIGKYVHRVAEAWSLGLPTPRVPLTVQRPIEQLRAWFERARPRVIATEVQVYYRGPDGFRYAGTVDLIAWIRNAETGEEELWLIDIKTGRRLYPESVLQLASYGRATFIGGPDGTTELPMPAVDRYGILHVRPTFAKLKPARVDDECWATFRHAAAIHAWGVELSRGRLDKPITYPTWEDPKWQQTAQTSTALAQTGSRPKPKPKRRRAAATRAATSARSTTSDTAPSSRNGRKGRATRTGSRTRSRTSSSSSSGRTGPSRHNKRGPDGRFIPAAGADAA